VFPGKPEHIAVLDSPQLERLARLIPAPRSNNPSAGSGTDNSRSAIAFRKGAELRRVGKTYEEMVEALASNPETAAWVREKGMAAGQRQLRRVWEKAEPGSAAPEFSDEGLALQFSELHADDLRHVSLWGRWLVWSGTRWQRDHTLMAFDLARAV